MIYQDKVFSTNDIPVDISYIAHLIKEKVNEVSFSKKESYMLIDFMYIYTDFSSDKFIKCVLDLLSKRLIKYWIINEQGKALTIFPEEIKKFLTLKKENYVIDSMKICQMIGSFSIGDNKIEIDNKPYIEITVKQII